MCTDGAASMTGIDRGVVKQIQERPGATCRVDTLLLAQRKFGKKQMSPELHEVINVAVKTVNYIKKNALNSRCFAALCDRLYSDHLQLLYHSEVRWLSRGRVLNRLFELRHEVHMFLEEKQSPLAEH